MDLSLIQCFFMEKTGRVIQESYTCECGDPKCSGVTKFRETEEWRRTDTGEVSLKGPYSSGPGAMWLEEIWDIHSDENGIEQARYKGIGQWNNDDGLHLFVRVPGGTYEGKMYCTSWDVDSRASNCTLMEDRMHRCWVRTGIPPNITVNKAGFTCAAGAGSIKTEFWHGMLENGVLRAV